MSDTRDPFYNLPAELLICIFDFLHPYDVWAKRLICRRWNTILSSDNFSRTALNRFETHDPSDSALALGDHTSSSNMLALRHTLALRNGRPFSYVNYGDKFAFKPKSHPIAHQLRLKCKYLAYLRGKAETREGTTVVIRDLVTGETTSLCGTAREKIMLIELSTDIIAFFTYVGTMYVASLLALPDSLHSVRLPSSSVRATHADRGLLGCLLGGMSDMTVFIHDTETGKSTSFSHRKNAYCDEKEDVHCHAVLVNAYDMLIDIFSVVSSSIDLTLYVKAVQYSLAGELKMHECLTIDHELESIQHASLGSVLPTGEQGLFQLALSSVDRKSRTLSGTILFDANFDPNTATLKMVDRDLRNTVLWKDRLYRPEKTDVLINTARRRAPYDGPRSLRALSNEGDLRMTDEVYARSEIEDKEFNLPSNPIRTRWCPSSVRSWQRGPKDGYSGSIVMPRHRDQPPMLPALVPVPPPVHHIGPWPREQTWPAEALHTVLAMNDTFVVGTCVNTSYIGVACLDERVKLYGSGLTNLWVHPDNHDWKRRLWQSDYRDIGPGFLPLKRPKRTL